MLNTTQRLSWLSSLATAAFIGFTTLLSGCGGGGADSSAPATMTVTPSTATVYAYSTAPTTLTIRNGKKPFHVVSDNAAIISFNSATMVNGTVPDETIELGGPSGTYGRVNNVDLDTVVNLTVFDADNKTVSIAITVKPSALNDSLMVNGIKTLPGENDVFNPPPTYPGVNNGETASASVTAKTTTGGVLSGHKIRFRVMDQGPIWGFVCNPSLGDCLVIESDASGRVITVETTTDVNGNAYAVLRTDSTATSQFATIRATDMNTGQMLTGQFLIVGDALAVVPASGTWTIGAGDGDGLLEGQVNPDALGAGAVAAESAGGCSTAALPGAVVSPALPLIGAITPPVNGNTGATTGFYVYGGTPPYTITSTASAVAGVSATSTGTFAGTAAVATANTQFFVRAMCNASGNSTIIVADSAGTVLSTTTFTVTFAW